jgi:hypothetical protein
MKRKGRYNKKTDEGEKKRTKPAREGEYRKIPLLRD